MTGIAKIRTLTTTTSARFRRGYEDGYYSRYQYGTYYDGQYSTVFWGQCCLKS